MGIGLVERICRRHMRKHALDLEVFECRDLLDILHRKVEVVCQIADAAHTGIHRDQRVDSLVLCFRCRGEGCRILGAADNRGDIVIDDGVRIHVRCQTEHDDLFLRAGLTQGDRLLQRRDRKSLTAVRAQHLRDFDRAMTVSVCLDDADHLSVSDFIFDLFDIVI